MEGASPGRRETLLQRYDGDSPVVSMKRLMQQLREELEGLRQQQDAVLRQFAEQRRQEEENRSWVKERLEGLERKLHDASASASALTASASAAAASANAAAVAAAAATGSRAPLPGAPPPASSGAAMPLPKASSFEFARLANFRGSKEGSGSSGGFGSLSLVPGPGLAPTAAKPLGDGPGPGDGEGSGGLAVSLGSPRRRFRMPSSSGDDDDGDDDGAAGEMAGGGAGRPAGRAATRARSRRDRAKGPGNGAAQDTGALRQEGEAGHGGAHGEPVSVFAAAGAQAQAMRELAGRGRAGSGGGTERNVREWATDATVGAGAGGGAGKDIDSAHGRRAGAGLRSGGSSAADVSGSLQEAMPSFTRLPEGGPPSAHDSGPAAVTVASASQPWASQNLSSLSTGSSLAHSLPHSISMGHGNPYHHYYHPTHSHSFGHGHHHHGHGHLQRHFSHNHHQGSSSAFGSVALLFPTLRHGSSTEDLATTSMPAAVPSSPQRASSPRGAPHSPRAAGPGGGVLPLGLELARASVSAVGVGGSGGGAPSLARDSLRSVSVTDLDDERVEAASTRHFKGIPPRLVEIYRQRAEQSHWSLQADSVQLLRSAGRRGSTESLQRQPGSLARNSTQSVVAGAATGSAANGMTRMSLRHGRGGGGGGGSKTHDGGGGGGGEDPAGWVQLDPNYDHPPMIGDDEEYIRPMTLLERLRLYLVGLIRPEGRTKWDLFILTLLVWVLFASPVIICFGLSGDALNGDWVGIVELCVDFAFVIDIYLNFRTAYYDSKGHLCTERWRIARHYLKTWFLLDLICVIPYDIITAGTMGFLSMLKLLRVMRVGKVIRMIRMYRLLRVIRLPRILERMEMFIDRGVLQVMAFILSVCLLAHLSACIFFYMAYLDGLGPQTWVAAYGVQDADLATKYLTSLYWAFTTTATVGYGDITPKTDKEKILAIFVMCMGVSLVGYVTSSITNIMAIKNAQQTNIAAKKQLVMDVLKSRSVPSELSRRVYNYFDYVSSKMIKREEAALLADLPFKLRSRLLTSFYAETLSRIPGISRLPPHVLIELVSQLKSYYFVEGDIVAMQGDYVDALYIVSEGLLEARTYMFPADVEPWRIFEAVHKDELRHMPYTAEGRLKPRYFFGQAGVLHGGVWPATVIARNCCELLALDREGLQHMMALQPELADMLGVPKEPVPASVAHAAFLSGPGANALLPPADRAALIADFPLMDPAPQRGLMQSMLRSMGHMITGGLARASAAHYPHMPGGAAAAVTHAPGTAAASCGGGGSGGGDVDWAGGGKGKGAAASGGSATRSVLQSGLALLGWRKLSGGGGSGDGGGGYAAAGTGSAAPTPSRFSRFRPFGRKGPHNVSVLQLPTTTAAETSSLLLDGRERSDAATNGDRGGEGYGGTGPTGSSRV